MTAWVGTGAGVSVGSGALVCCGVAVGVGSVISVGGDVFVDLGVSVGSGSLAGSGVAAFMHPARLNKVKTVPIDKEKRLNLILYPSQCKHAALCAS